MPLANWVPTSVRLAFTAALAVDASVSVGVASDLKRKLHGSSKPEVESEVGSW